MRVTIISSSYRKNGATAVLVDNFIRGLYEGNSKCEIRKIELIEANINYCKGCMACLKNEELKVGKCGIKDDINDILEKCINADLIVFASPIYEGYVTALMKKFMERTLCLSTLKNGRPMSRLGINKDKKGIILLASGVPYPLNVIVGITKEAKGAMKTLMKTIGVKNPKVVVAGDIKDNVKNTKKYAELVYELGRKYSGKEVNNENRRSIF